MSEGSRSAPGRVRIAARHSDLARLQAYRVGSALTSKAGSEVEFAFRASLGDINQKDPLWQMPEKGVFTQDFLRDLREGTADLVVHSWKDLPTEARTDTAVVATMPRADLRDILLFRRDRLEIAGASGHVRILTSSPRRTHNLGAFLSTHLPFRAEVTFESVRGNIPTRLRKMLEQDVDGLIVAKAALDRLLQAEEPEFAKVQKEIRAVLEKSRFMVLPLTVNPTAAAQGALAIEIAAGRDDLRLLLKKIDCPETFTAVESERKILASYGGGCHQKIGVSVLKRSYGEITFLRGLTDDGRVLDRVSLSSSAAPAPRAKSADALFPLIGEESTFFAREALEKSKWEAAQHEAYLWVARETAWPESFLPTKDAYVWTAGLRTWEKLAARGVWVTGSAEGLGESEPTLIETLVGRAKHGSDVGTIDWLKLSHDALGPAEQSTFRLCATYRLVPRAEVQPELKNRTHFFWMSGSTFDRAVAIEPSITRSGTHHACGPGLTQRHIVAKLGRPVSIHLGLESWRAETAPGAS
jgi:hydroxymethylbilane synthase